jgi:subtilisin family serine protease
MTQDIIRHYVVLRPNTATREAYKAGKVGDIRSAVTMAVYGREFDHSPFEVRALPSNDISSPFDRDNFVDKLDKLIVALDITGGGGKLKASHEVVGDILTAVKDKRGIVVGSSPDLNFNSVDHWCIGETADPIFSDRTAAERTVGIDYLRAQPGTDGQGVNVVIVDQGIDATQLGTNYGGGWSVGLNIAGQPTPQPGTVRPAHGMMIANNILKVAPKALLFDLPLVPQFQIPNIQSFLSTANAAYLNMLMAISLWKGGQFPGPWVVVNPWGIFSRKTEIPLGHYTQNPLSPFNVDVAGLAGLNIDVLFAAGNCGQFCPDRRCGGRDRGPSRSIWGANSLQQVLTVGAVRADDMWMGYSSQGPGQLHLGAAKPDFCATSQFCEDDDAFNINTGTSAATGLTAGVIAALRSRWNPGTVPPQALQQILNQTARKPTSVPWTNVMRHRLGNGVLDARAAYELLKSKYP